MKEKANNDIRQLAAKCDIALWQIAEIYGLSESYFCRKLRHELDPEEKQRVIAIIENLSREA